MRRFGVVGTCLVVAALAFGGGWAARSAKAQGERKQAAAAASAARVRRQHDSACVLATRDSAPIVAVFESYVRAKEFADAARRGEPQSTLDLILKDADGVVVARGTTCSVISPGTNGGVSEIRITAGPKIGATGYVPEEWRKPE